ncbi:MAG: BatB protein [Planctomycetes bacterium]|nr:BatB protein [Planctomycetota bacterium]
MIELGLPWVLATLPLPILAWRFLPRAKERRAGALRVPFFDEMIGSVRAGVLGRVKRFGAIAAMIGAWSAMVVAAAQPSWVGEPQSIPTQGRDLMLALDLSGSMAQQDFAVNDRPIDRLSIVKAVAKRFVEDREGDRLGLILFGSRAYLQTPLTTDRETVGQMLDEAELGLAGKETAIGDAIGLAVKRLGERTAEERVLVLLSDGASNAGVMDPIRAAEFARQAGIRIYTIGIGADTRAFGGLGLMSLGGGDSLDEETLRRVAETTGGNYFRATSTEGLIEVYRRIDELEPSEGRESHVRPMRALFHFPLGAAFVLSAMLVMAHVAGALGWNWTAGRGR